MSGNCAPTYNFYNCCDPNGGGGADQVHKFIWSAGDIGTTTQEWGGSGIDPLLMGGSVSIIDSDKTDFLSLQPLPLAADLQSLHILRFASNAPGLVDVPPSYTGSIDLEAVVMDYMGNTVRTISLAPMNYLALPNKVWTPMPLTSVAAHLSIQVGELVAARVKFSAANPSVRLAFNLTGVGQF